MRKSQIVIGSLATLVLTSWVSSALAETTPAVGTSETQATSVMDKISASFATSLYGGPALTDPLSPYAPNVALGRGNRDESTATFLRSGIGANYKLSDTLSVGPTVSFDLKTFSPGEGAALTLLDPYVKLSHSKLISSGNLSLSGSVRLYAPVSTASQNAGIITIVRSDQSLNYTISDSRLSLGLNTFIAGSIVKKATISVPDETGALKSKTLNALTVYAGPNVSYQMTPSLAAVLVAEMGASRKMGSGLTDFYTRTDYTNLAPGVSWDIMPGMNFSPALSIPIGQRIALDTTSLYFDFSWKFL